MMVVMRGNYGIAMFAGVATACVLVAGIAAGWLYLENQKLKRQVEFLELERAEVQTMLKQMDERAREIGTLNACLNQLRMLEGGKQQWALERRKDDSDVPTRLDLAEYLPGGFPMCPAGGSYFIGQIAESPQCSMPGHALP